MSRWKRPENARQTILTILSGSGECSSCSVLFEAFFDPQRPTEQQCQAGQATERVVRRGRGNLTMTLQSSVQNLWSVTRAALGRLKRLLAETGNSDDMIFDIRDPGDRRPSRTARGRRPTKTLNAN